MLGALVLHCVSEDNSILNGCNVELCDDVAALLTEIEQCNQLHNEKKAELLILQNNLSIAVNEQQRLTQSLLQMNNQLLLSRTNKDRIYSGMI